MKRDERIHLFAGEIWEWFARCKRKLPWRDLPTGRQGLAVEDDTERAYRVLVSEMMLQQTQVPRVIVIYRRFLEQFPQLKDLACASNREVILAWRGMGYNNRALRLRDAARTILAEFDGTFPRDMDHLQSLKGVGHYTAAAIRNFAFNIPTPCIDTNIRRILHRTFVGPENHDGTWKKGDEYLLQLAAEVLEHALQMDKRLAISGKRLATANWHAALMDFGSLVQTKRNPKWEQCPLTAKGIMKATEQNMPDASGKGRKTEPGRMVGSRFIPNRIFRGKIVEALRDSKKGMTLEEIGKEICIDWCGEEKQCSWLQDCVLALQRDQLVMQKADMFLLTE